MSRPTQGSFLSAFVFVYGTVTLFGIASQLFLLTLAFVLIYERPYNPDMHAHRFGLFPIRSPLLWESFLLSSPPGTEMFHFPGSSFSIAI